MTILRTKRLELRPLCAGDVERVTGLATDPRVMASLGGPRSAPESRAWLDQQLAHIDEHGYGRYAVTRESEFVGCVGLLRDDFDRGLVPGIEVAWHLAFGHWHQGYATEASRAVIDRGFTVFDLSEVIAVTRRQRALPSGHGSARYATLAPRGLRPSGCLRATHYASTWCTDCAGNEPSAGDCRRA